MFAEATPEQIAIFKQAASNRYAERGIKPEDAQKLFDASLAKLAEEMSTQLRLQKTASAVQQRIAQRRTSK